MAASKWHLQQKHERIVRDINAHLDLLIGSVSSQGATGRFNLTTKVDGKTKSRYIRAGMEKEVKRRTRRHLKFKALIKELAEVNWQLLQIEMEQA
jgi:hypothetical protein